MSKQTNLLLNCYHFIVWNIITKIQGVLIKSYWLISSKAKVSHQKRNHFSFLHYNYNALAHIVPSKMNIQSSISGKSQSEGTWKTLFKYLCEDTVTRPLNSNLSTKTRTKWWCQWSGLFSKNQSKMKSRANSMPTKERFTKRSKMTTEKSLPRETFKMLIALPTFSHSGVYYWSSKKIEQKSHLISIYLKFQQSLRVKGGRLIKIIRLKEIGFLELTIPTIQQWTKFTNTGIMSSYSFWRRRKINFQIL